MEFSFDGALMQLRERGRDIGRTLVEPSVAARDRQAIWDPALFGALAEARLTGLLLPAGEGGLGLSVLEAVALLEGFGEGATDAGLAFALGVHGVLCGVPIATLGTPSQRAHYLPGIASGDCLGALALSELDGGATTAGDGVTAVRTRDGWQLAGTRPNVVNAPYAHHFLVTAAVGGGERTAFLIDRDNPGIAVLPGPEATALRTAPSAELVLTGCRVTPDAVLGTPGAATTELVPLLAALTRTCLLAPWLGVLRALAEHTFALAAQKLLFGGPLARSQAVRMAVVDLQTRVELGSTLLHRAAWQLGRGEPAPRMDGATAQLFLAAAVRDAADTAAGFAGTTPHHLVERSRRDVLALAATGGGEQVLRSVVAGALLDMG
jgi:alkylation response protein AidB-like acyl-CoA dehydrogenase